MVLGAYATGSYRPPCRLVAMIQSDNLMTSLTIIKHIQQKFLLNPYWNKMIYIDESSKNFR